MPEWLRSAVGNDQLLWSDVAVKQALAFVFGVAVAAVYHFTRGARTKETRSLMATLVLLTLLIAMISSVIGDNVARAFSLVGALSIVRFRTVVEDTRDTAFVILAVGVGMALGAGYLSVPVILVPTAALAAWLYRDRNGGATSSNSYELVVRTSLGASETMVEDVLSRTCDDFSLRSLSTARQGAALEMVYGLRLKSASSLRSLLEELTGQEGVAGVEVRRA